MKPLLVMKYQGGENKHFPPEISEPTQLYSEKVLGLSHHEVVTPFVVFNACMKNPFPAFLHHLPSDLK